MNIYHIFFVLLFICTNIEAQKISIKGQLKDIESNLGMELVNIALQTSDSMFITGTSSDKKGYFQFDKLPKGTYRLKISAIGYENNQIHLQDLSHSVDLGIIPLQPEVLALEGVTISASNILNQSDRKILFPNDKQLKLATNGINLLRTFMLPRLQINPLTDEISLIGNEELQLRINGAPASDKDVVALRANDIERIEYIENPGLRYGNAVAVLNYITKRKDKGGSINVDLTHSPHVLSGDDRVAGRLSYKKSEFGGNYFLGVRDYVKSWRNNEERFSFNDGNVIERYEIGKPGRFTRQTHNLSLNYNYLPSAKTYFNATYNYNVNNVPHDDFRSDLISNSSNLVQKINMIDLTAQKVKKNSLDLYLMKTLKDKQTLTFNLVGTYIKTNLNRLYQEKIEDKMLTDISSIIDGDKYSIIGEAIYEKTLNIGRLSAGIKHTQAFSDNLYRQTDANQAKMAQSETYAHAQFFGKIKKLDYSVGVAINRSYLNQDENKYNTYTFCPNISLRYGFNDNFYMRLNGKITNMSPRLSDLNIIEQYIDSLQIIKGNPDLSPYKLLQSTFYTEYRLGKFTISGDITYINASNPIMESIYQEGNHFVQTYENQKRAQKLWSSITLKVGMLWDILQFSITGGANYHYMEGNNYSHRYTNWYYQADLYATYKKWTFTLSQYSAWNNFWGESLRGGENGQDLLLTYKFKNLTIGGGLNNPFYKYKRIEENWNQYVNKKKEVRIDDVSCRFMLKLAWNMNFGNQLKGASKKVYNSDNDSGILNISK